MTSNLAENIHKIHIIGQLSINDSLQFLGVSVQAWERGLPFLLNMQAPAVATGWESGHTSNKNWEGSMFDANRNYKHCLGCFRRPSSGLLAVDSGEPTRRHTPCQRQLTLLQQSRVFEKPLQLAQSYRQSSGSSLVRQQGGSGYSILFVQKSCCYCKLSFSPVASVSNCIQISCKITFCVPCGHLVWYIVFFVVDSLTL